VVFFIIHVLVLRRMAEHGWHAAVLVVWLGVGAVYNAVIWGRFGSDAGIQWFVGYVLEFIFLVENIFIFNIVIQAFKTPPKMTTQALHIVVWAQIMFEMIFFMGLAAWLRSFKVLPYILGVWLICCGFLAAYGGPCFEVDIMETKACQAFTACLGDRLSRSYEKDGHCLLRDSSGKLRVSLLGLVVFVLLLVDFLLEIDVVLTKVEELSNPYIAFTSSAVAAFSIPNLFFVSQAMLERFKMLKYGIGFVLVLFGTQMLLSSVYILRPIVACCIIVGVLIACVVISACKSLCAEGGDSGHAGPALAGVGQGIVASNPQGADEDEEENEKTNEPVK
jgi:tellurite resistance protein TerC